MSTLIIEQMQFDDWRKGWLESLAKHFGIPERLLSAGPARTYIPNYFIPYIKPKRRKKLSKRRIKARFLLGKAITKQQICDHRLGDFIKEYKNEIQDYIFVVKRVS